QDLKSGLIDAATEALGRPYRLSGTVIHGLARGRLLGFPTANLGHISQLIPAAGVYATYALINGEKFSAMTSIGYNPTFAQKTLTVETHIFDFDRFIYDQEISIDFIANLRQMLRFKSPEDLADQLNKDAEMARQCLKIKPLSYT
ncbi:MAG: riboflavin kinase, partial [Candidatus Adiutrix sp.]